MENGKRKTKDKDRALNFDGFSAVNYPLTVKTVCCTACGAEATRETAKFCLTCGKRLKEDYIPLDNLRASYRLQGKSFDLPAPKREEVRDLFHPNRNVVSETAWACFVYSLVPYLGILFVPLTIIVGSFGYAVALNQPHLGGRKLSAASVGLSFVVLGVQIFLWWLLYIIPELGRAI
jgi:hypothetical protein